MKRSIGTILLSALAVATGAIVVQAQVIDADACEKACNRDHAACVDSCGDGDNPEDCDEQCNEDWQDCLRQCE